MDRQYYKTNVSPSYLYHNTVEHTLDIIADTIGKTFGPYGSHTLFKTGPEIKASKDGFENLTMMRMSESIPQAVYHMALDVASRQASRVGDGTTSAILIMANVYKHLMKNKDLWNKYTPSEVKAAMSDIQHILISSMKSEAIPLKEKQDVYSLVYTSTDGDGELAQLLMDLYIKVEDLHKQNILIDYADGDKHFISTVQGMNVRGNMMSQAFANYDPDTCILTDAEVVIVDGKVNISNDIVNYANTLKPQGKSLIILCSGVNDNFYRFIEAISQSQPEVLSNFCVAYTNADTIRNRDSFHDLLNVTGCPYLPEGYELSRENITQIKRGFARSVSIRNKQITLGGFVRTEEFERYMEGLSNQIDELQKTLDAGNIPNEEITTIEVKLNRMKSRYYRMRDGVTTVYVGGDTQQSKSINYRLVEDGIKALQSALEYGYFHGCNTTVPNILIRTMLVLKESDETMKGSLPYILKECLLKAYLDVYKRLILNRTNLDDDALMRLILGDENFDAYESETGYINVDKVDYDRAMKEPIISTVNLRGKGTSGHKIINPAKTDMNIVEVAIDSALVLATANTIITDTEEFEGMVHV